MNSSNPFLIFPIPGFHEPVSSWSHLIGAVAAFIGLYFLVRRARGSAPRVFSLVVYSFSLLFLFSMSGVYHLLERGTLARDVFQRLDHAGIWLLIAGTFTPIHTILFRGIWRWAVLVGVWVIAITGLTLEVIFFTSVPEWLYMCFYLGLGWVGVLSFWQFRKQFSHNSIVYLALGGVFYTIGAIFEYSQWPVFVYGVIGPHEVFHLFVILAAGAQWFFIYSWCDQPVRSKIEIHVKIFPNKVYLAQGINEKIEVQGESLEQVREAVRALIEERYHLSIRPQVLLKYINQEIL